MAPMRRSRVWLAAGLLVLATACAPEADDQAGDAPADGTGVDGGTATFVAVDIDFTQAPDQLSAGSYTFELVSEGQLEHNVTIEELGDRLVVAADAGETATGTVDLDAGTYIYYCSVEGHREAGMEGTLTVN